MTCMKRSWYFKINEILKILYFHETLNTGVVPYNSQHIIHIHFIDKGEKVNINLLMISSAVFLIIIIFPFYLGVSNFIFLKSYIKMSTEYIKDFKRQEI